MNRNIPLDYYRHTISKPDVIQFNENYSHFLVIDSRERNKFLFPNSNNYTVGLSNMYTDVIEVELLSVNYKNPTYLINNSNNTLYLSFNSNDLVIKIPNGDYTVTQLTDTINQFLLLAKNLFPISSDITIQINYDPIKDNFYFIVFDSVTPSNIFPSLDFSVDFKGDQIFYPMNLFGNYPTTPSEKSTQNIFEYITNSIGKVIGFSPTTFNNQIQTISMLLDLPNTLITFVGLESNLNILEQIININNINTRISYSDGVNTDNIPISDITGYVRNSPTSLTIKVPTTTLTNAITSNVIIYTNMLLGDLRKIMETDNLILLEIEPLSKLESNIKIIQNSLAKISTDDSSYKFTEFNKKNCNIVFFNPPVRIDRLAIRFKDINGNIIDTNSYDNTIHLAITTLNKNKTIETVR